MLFPSPEEQYIAKEELLEMLEKADKQLSTLFMMMFKQQDIYDAWYARTVERKPISIIAAVQKISWHKAKRRIDTANEIITSFRSSLHKIDDTF